MNTVRSGKSLVIDSHELKIKLDSVLSTLLLAQGEDQKDQDFLINEAINQLHDMKRGWKCNEV